MPKPPKLKVALVHDWLTGMRGGEYMLEAIAGLFPEAELFTLLCLPDRVSPRLAALRRHTSFLQRLPGAAARYRHFLPLMPAAIERFDLRGFELVISSSHCVAKGARKPAGAVHLSYVYTPMRYMWDGFDDYFGPGKASLAVRAAARAARPWLQRWDRRVSAPGRVDAIVGDSRFVSARIARFYGREAQTIYPFADLSRFRRPRSPGAEYLMVGAFAPYKRVDLAIEAFNRLRLPLIVAGGGQEERRLRALAGPTIRFVGDPGNEQVAELYSRCRAFVFPGREDFGITPLEAMASGAPVIAFGEGGAAETVTERTGVFFRTQSVDALAAAVEAVESGRVRPPEEACRARAAEFSRERFEREFREAVARAWIAAGKDRARLGF